MKLDEESVNALPLTQIGDEQVAAYARDGVVCLLRVFDRNWIDLLHAAIEDASAVPGSHAEVYTPAGEPGRFWGDLDLWQRCPASAGSSSSRRPPPSPPE